MKLQELKQIIREIILSEISTTGSIAGYSSKYAFRKKLPGETFDYDYSGYEGTGKPRKTRHSPLTTKEMDRGMKIVGNVKKNKNH